MADILGISPGTKSIGIALLKDGDLVDWKLKSFQPKWSEQKLHLLVQYISRYLSHADAVAIKIPDELPTSHNYIQLVATLNVLLERNGIKAVYYMLSDLKKHHCANVVVTKETLSACIATKYPELVPKHSKEQTNKWGYYSKIFEAVAAARMYHNELNN
ncbi:MAG: hypothetical protein JST10_02825 [Bacteroidetes bacterium]|nr:hypothetical protein [Bacteroidota bacterium]